MEYTIATGDNSTQAIKVVKELMDNGWLPIGGISVSMRTDGDGYSDSIFAQALVRNRDTAEKLGMPDTKVKS